MLKGNYYNDYLRECDNGKASRVLFEYLIKPNEWNENQFTLYYFVIGFFSANTENRIKIVKGIERYCQVHHINLEISNYLRTLVDVENLNKELFLDILNVINDGDDVKGFDLKLFVEEVLKEDRTFIPNPQKIYNSILKEFF